VDAVVKTFTNGEPRWGSDRRECTSQCKCLNGSREKIIVTLEPESCSKGHWCIGENYNI
jgi:hypothetical protein